MFGLFDSKSEKLSKKISKLSKEVWATARRLCRKGPSNFWIKYLVETEIHLDEVLEDLRKETDEKYVENVLNNLTKEYEKSPLRISEKHRGFVSELSTNYRLENKIYWPRPK
tara:strand:+ start:369 stop:704 length:336 start_codon:yes stop_codon:yes gene_type:complete